MLHVTDDLREAVQACDYDKANTRRRTYARLCDDSTILQWINKSGIDGLLAYKNRVQCILLLNVLEGLASD